MQLPVDTSPATSTTRFPDEVLFYVLLFLSPREVVRLRLVSRQFNGVTRDARLWRALYTDSRLLRPSGPFLWQSAQFLERILIHSARVSQTWTSQPITVVSRLRGPRIPVQRSPVSTSYDFLFGRLFIWCEGEHLLAQDLETGAGRLLWESSEPISSLNACSLTFPDSERVFVALRHIDEPFADRTPIKLLEFPLQDDVRLMLGPMTFEMDLPTYANFPLSAKAPFLYFDGGTDRLFSQIYERTVIDARTWAIYRFPAFSSGIDAIVHLESVSRWCEVTLLSGRHIIVFRPQRPSNPPMTLIQAFVTPDPSDADASQLRLTHEVLVGFSCAPICCLRSAIVDPSSGDVNMRFLATSDPHGNDTHILCVDFVIPAEESESTEVLPMSVSMQELLILSGLQQQTVFTDASTDGHGRGIVTLSRSESSESWTDPELLFIYKFSVDASGDHCKAMLSEPSELTSQDVFQYMEYNTFDGVRGRICHNVRVDRGSFDLMVLDLH